MGNIFLHIIFSYIPILFSAQTWRLKKKKKKPQVMRKLGEDALSDLPGWLLPREHSKKTLMLRGSDSNNQISKIWGSICYCVDPLKQ